MTSHRPRTLSRILSAATSKKVFSWQVVSLTSIYSVVLHLFASSDIGFTSILLRAASAAISVSPMFLIVFIAHSLRRKSESAQAIQVLISYVLAGAARGFTLATLLHLSGILEGGGWETRIFAGALSMSLTVAIITFFWSSYSDHVDAIAELEAETKNLSDALEQVSEEFQAAKFEKAAEISRAVVSELGRIELEPAEEQVEEIQRVINEHVRPMSLQMASDVQGWQPATAERRRFRFRDSWFTLNPVTKLPSMWFVLAISLSPLPYANAIFDSQRAVLLSICVFISLYPSVLIGFRIAKRIVPKFTSPKREIVFTLIMEAIAVPGVAASYLALLGTQSPGAFVIAGLVMFPIYAWILFVGGALYESVRENRRDLLTVSESLRWAIARINLLSWYHRGIVSRLLHGPIQNSMHAALIRLQNREIEAPVDNLIRDLKDRIENADTTENTVGVEGIQKSLKDMVSLWAGIAEGKVEIDPETLQTLSQDLPAAVILLDLTNELYSNAIRHGKATKLSIEISTTDKTVCIVAVDDGDTPSFSAGKGLGQRFLDNCSTSWSSTRVANLNRLEVVLPLSVLSTNA